jgi:hypothetical protein
MVLIAVTVIGLVAAGVLAGELYARHRAESVVAAATECVVQDKASVSFGVRRRFCFSSRRAISGTSRFTRPAIGSAAPAA